MEWINVKDRLPQVLTGSYIVYLENRVVMEMNFADLTSPRWYRLFLGDESPDNKVTHWMPLPEPPKK